MRWSLENQTSSQLLCIKRSSPNKDFHKDDQVGLEGDMPSLRLVRIANLEGKEVRRMGRINKVRMGKEVEERPSPAPSALSKNS